MNKIILIFTLWFGLSGLVMGCIAPPTILINSNTIKSNIMREIWKPIKDYEGLYEVSNLGKLKSLGRDVWNPGHNCFRKQYPRIMLGSLRDGYSTVVLTDLNGVHTRFSVHRLVADAFIPNKDCKPEVNHINSVRDDNRIENLEWVTRSENQLHGYAKGNKVSGEGHNFTKLTLKQVNEIRLKYKPFVYSLPMLAKEYGISISNIHSIIHKKTWKHY